MADSNSDHILIVDDDAELRGLLKQFLEGKGYRISQSGDGWDAVREIVVQLPDLVVMDIHMPKMTGLGALDVLGATRLNDQIPILITSAAGDKDTILKAVQLGADDFIVKPFSFEHLASRIAFHLFRLSTEHLRRLLLKLPKHPNAPVDLSFPGPEEEKKYRDWMTFVTTFDGRDLCVLLKKGFTLPEGAVAPEATLRENVLVFAKSRVAWKCVWPYTPAA